jgi:hypothetical protein
MDMMKLIGAFHNYANAPKKEWSYSETSGD